MHSHSAKVCQSTRPAGWGDCCGCAVGRFGLDLMLHKYSCPANAPYIPCQNQYLKAALDRISRSHTCSVPPAAALGWETCQENRSNLLILLPTSVLAAIMVHDLNWFDWCVIAVTFRIVSVPLEVKASNAHTQGAFCSHHGLLLVSQNKLPQPIRNWVKLPPEYHVPWMPAFLQEEPVTLLAGKLQKILHLASSRTTHPRKTMLI